jgi:hypothetical protein
MSDVLDAMSLSEIIVLVIDPSPLGSAEELINFQLTK